LRKHPGAEPAGPVGDDCREGILPGKISGPENTAAPDMIATETPKFPPGRGKGVPGRILSEPCGREGGEEGQVEIPGGCRRDARFQAGFQWKCRNAGRGGGKRAP